MAWRQWWPQLQLITLVFYNLLWLRDPPKLVHNVCLIKIINIERASIHFAFPYYMIEWSDIYAFCESMYWTEAKLMKCKLFRVIVFMLLLVFVFVFVIVFAFGAPRLFSEEGTIARSGLLMVIISCLSFSIWICLSNCVCIFICVCNCALSEEETIARPDLLMVICPPTVYQRPHWKVCKFTEHENDSLRNCRTNPSTNRCVLVTFQAKGVPTTDW